MSHLEECKDDWNSEEIDKPKHERIPLPKPTSDFTKMLTFVQQLAQTAKDVDRGTLFILYFNHLDSQGDDQDTGSDEGMNILKISAYKF